MLALYAWHLDVSPPYLADDEVTFALQAHAIATTGYDLAGRLMPLYFQMGPLGETSWFHPALVYFSVPFVALLHFSEATVRLPSAIVGLANILLTYFIGRRVFGRSRDALLAAFVLALTPAHFMLSRLTADYIYPVPFVLAWLLLLLQFLETQNPRTLFLSTLCLGVGVYSYIASVIMMPVYLTITWVVLALRTRQFLRHATIAAAGFALPLVLIPAWLAFHPQVVAQTLARYGQKVPALVPEDMKAVPLEAALRELRRPSHFGGIVRRITLYWYFFDPAYLFVTGGYANPINSTRHTAVFLLPLLAFVPVGVWQIAKRSSDVSHWLLIVGFLSAPIAAISVPEPYALDREAALLPFGALLAAMGASAFMASDHRWVRRTAAALLLMMPLQFGVFLYEYYHAYRGQVAFWMGHNHQDAMELLIAQADKSPRIYLTTATDPAVDAYWQFALIKEHREALLAKTVHYDPATLDVAAIPAGSLMLAQQGNRDIEPLVAKGQLRKVAEIPEIADPPQFIVLAR